MASWGFPSAAPAGPQVTAGPDLAEITTNSLGFQALAGETKLKLLPQPWPEDQLPPPTASLLSVASRKGLVAAAGPETLVIATTEAVRKGYHGEAPTENNVKSFTPQATISIPRLSHVAFSTDETFLVISAENGGGFNVYDVDALLQGKQDPTFQMGTNNISVRVLLANPAPELAHLYAVVLTDGKLMVANLRERKLSNVFREGVSCISWSAKGKQLVAGLEDGSAAQYDPEGVQKAVIPKPPQLTDPWPMMSICWVTNEEFLTIHTPLSGDGDSTDSVYHMLYRDKASGAFTSRKLSGDPCPAFGMPRTPAHHFVSRLRRFPPSLDEVLILSSTAAVDVGVVTKASASLAAETMPSDATINTYTTTAMADDTRRAQMPMSAGDGMGDTSPIGMALDLSSKDPVVKPIPQEEIDESPTPIPALMLLNNEGLLSAWWIIYNDSIRQSTIYPGLVAAPAASAPSTQSAPPSATASIPSPFNTSSQAKPANGSAPTFGTFGGASSLGSKPSPWGGAAQGAAPTFGQPSFGSTSSIGGAAAGFGSTSALGGKPSAWGASVSSQPTSGATFGQASAPFGGSAASGVSGFAALGSTPAVKPAFASSNGNTSLQSPFSSFGNQSASPFGTVGAGGQKAPAFSSFGQASDKPAITPQPSFGSTVTLPSTTSGSFGGASTIGAKPSPWASPAQNQSSFSTAREEAMSDDEGNDDAGKSSQETAKPAPEASKPSFSFGQPSNQAKTSPFAQLSSDKPSSFGQPSDKPATQSPFAPKPNPSPFAPVSAQPGSSPFSQLTKQSGQSLFGKASESPSAKPTGIPSLTGFKLGSTFKGDGSGKDDVPPTKDQGKSPFSSAFSNILNEAVKDTPKEPETPIKKEHDVEEPKLQNISDTPSSPPKAKDQPDEKGAAEPEDAPLPPDFTTFKPKPVEEDLPPIAGSPPVDLGAKSQLSSPVSSIHHEHDEDGDEDENGEDDDEDEDGEDEDGEDENEGDDDEEEEEEIDGSSEHESGSWADEDDDDDDDEEGPNQDDTVSRPPKSAAATSFGSRLTFPSAPAAKFDKYPVPSTTPAGLPKAPLFAPPAKKSSPRSPSPMRPDRSTGAPPSQSIFRQSAGKQPLTVPSMGARASSSQTSATQKTPPPPPEPEAGSLSDDEDARIQELLREPIEPTRNLEPFVAHQDYIGEVTKPGIGGQIEKVYRDINSMIDTLGLNVRSLEAFVQGHESSQGDRERSDLEDAEDWCLVETADLAIVERNLNDDLDDGRVDEVQDKLNDLTALYKESTRLRTRTTDLRKQLAPLTDPQQRSKHRASLLNAEVQTQQTELRQGVSKVQKLLQEAEESLSVLRANLASAPSTTNGTSTQRTPTFENVTNTILKMTAMIEQKSGDVDVLEAQIKRLPQGIAGLSLDDETDFMRSSVRSLNGRGGGSIYGTPPSRSRIAVGNATPLGMSGMFSSSTRLQTPQTNRRGTYGFSYSPENSGDLRSSVRSLSGSTRKKMSDVSTDEVARYLSKKEQRAKVLATLKETIEKRGARVTKADNGSRCHQS